MAQKPLRDKAGQAARRGGKSLIKSIASDTQRNAQIDQTQQPQQNRKSRPDPILAVGKFLLYRWKIVLTVLAVLFVILTLVVATNAATSAGNQIKQTVSHLLPDTWGTQDADDEYRLSPEDQQRINQELAHDKDIQQIQHELDACLGEGLHTIDNVVSYAAETIDKDTKHEYAQAWITYVSSDPIARSALIYHHPEAAAADEGHVLTPEEITASGQPIYTRDEIYTLYDTYAQNFPPSQRSAEDFVRRVAPHSNPERFSHQIRAVSWALYAKNITPDGKQHSLERVLNECRKDLRQQARGGE